MSNGQALLTRAQVGPVVGIAVVIAAVRVILAEQSEMNRMLWQGGVLVGVTWAVASLLAFVPATVRDFAGEEWREVFQWGLALAIAFGVTLTDLVDAKTVFAVPLEFLARGFAEGVGAYGDKLTAAPFPASLLLFLVGLLLLVVAIPIALGLIVVLLPFVLLEHLARNGGPWSVVEQLVFTGMLACTVRAVVVPMVVAAMRPLAPALAVAIHDLFLSAPENIERCLQVQGWFAVRVRSPGELVVGLLALALAVLAHFLEAP